jgi:hypothetical protein
VRQVSLLEQGGGWRLETVITVITVIDSPHDHMDIDHMGVFVVVVVVRVRVESNPSVVEFFLAYLGPCVS